MFVILVEAEHQRNVFIFHSLLFRFLIPSPEAGIPTEPRNRKTFLLLSVKGLMINRQAYFVIFLRIKYTFLLPDCPYPLPERGIGDYHVRLLMLLHHGQATGPLSLEPW